MLTFVLALSLTAHSAAAEDDQATADVAATFAATAERLKAAGREAFAEQRWHDAADVYGRLVAHLLAGGYAEESSTVAASRFRIALAFKGAEEDASALTVLLHLGESAPKFRAAERKLLVAELRESLGLPASQAEPPPPTGAPVVESPFEGPVRVGGDVTRPELISHVYPVYPRDGKRGRVRGVVIVEATIDRWGNVTDVEVIKPLPRGLSQAAVDAVKQWKFRPATYRGQPVDVYYNLTVNFRLP